MNQSIAPLSEKTIQTLIHEIRGQKVMLDFDLARIYGYSTKAFNQQVKNNADKFELDFMFRLTSQEWDDILRSKKLTANAFIVNEGRPESGLRSKKSTANANSKRRYLPFAFTEQGIYMLMTVLRGDLAVRQSKTLIRLFKSMKDYIVETQSLGSTNEVLALANQVRTNTEAISKIEGKLDMVMDNFIDPSTYKSFLIMDGEKVESSLAYRSIFSLAKTSILLIDDYIGLKTLGLLKSCANNVEITIVSDNKARDGLSPQDLQDFTADTGNGISLAPNNGRVHDRYVVLDYGTKEEIIYHCGASSKDGGKKVSTMMRVENPQDYHRFIDSLFS